MSTRLELLKVLTEHKNQYLSGQALASSLGLSRNAIWKAIELLKKQGYQIDSKPSVGYKLLGDADILSKDAILENLNRPARIKIFDSVTSTSTVAMNETLGDEPIVIIANSQTAGRGRLGRSFFAPADSGLYMSIVFKPSFDLEQATLVTMATAIAVCEAIETLAKVSPRIKWVNDIFVDGKKVCGILTEAATNFESGNIDKLVIGIGVNCYETLFPADLLDIAAPLAVERTSFARNDLAAAILQNLFQRLDHLGDRALIMDYKKRCFILGKKIIVKPNLDAGEAIKARAIDIEEHGGLVVEYLQGKMSREMHTITTGEVSIVPDDEY